MKVNKWKIFIWERFNPPMYFLMVFVFLAAHYAVYLRWDLGSALSFQSVGILYFATTLFFLKLRLYDEVKDYEHDVRHYPKRPLPRGLLAHRDIHRAIIFIIVLEIFLFGIFGLKALLAILPAIFYSLLMYKEFFIRDWLRKHLVAYAVSHTVVVVFLSLAIFSAMKDVILWDLSKEILYFALASWFIFNIFEFGRKTFVSAEEKNSIDSYSKIFGRHGAVFLTSITAIVASLLLMAVLGFYYALAVLPLLLILSGIAYSFSDKAQLGRVYRIVTSLYLIFIYSSLFVISL